MNTYFIEFTYLAASILFILGLKGLSHPETAKRGMHLAETGMLLAIVGAASQRANRVHGISRAHHGGGVAMLWPNGFKTARPSG